jgi:hypothetical protein
MHTGLTKPTKAETAFFTIPSRSITGKEHVRMALSDLLSTSGALRQTLVPTLS